MSRRLARALAGGSIAAMLGAAPLAAAEKKPPAPAPAAKAAPSSMLPGATSHDPIAIDAGKLDYFDKEQRLVYSGNVVAVQGDSTLKASQLTIFLTKDAATTGGVAPAGAETAAAANAAAPAAGSSVRHMDAKGPVTLISKDQVGTGDNGTYDKDQNKVTLTGNVTLSQGTNVTKGDRLVYDLTSGQAQVFSGQTYQRVKSIFTPGSGAPGDPAAGTAKPKAPKPKAAGGTASAQ